MNALPGTPTESEWQGGGVCAAALGEPLKWVSVHAHEGLQLVKTQAALD